MSGISVFSETGKLKKVLVHRPGKEFDALTPTMLKRLSYDDMPQTDGLIREHDRFTELLRSRGAEVVYLADLAAQALDSCNEARENFISRYIEEARIASPKIRELSHKFLSSISDNKELIAQTMRGINIDDLRLSKKEKRNSLADLSFGDHRVVAEAIACPLFTRDPFAFIGEGVSINRMYGRNRRRETIYGEYIFKYHEDFCNVDIYRSRYDIGSLEGGDILVLSRDVLAAGISLRTCAEAVESLAAALFARTGFKTVLAFQIPALWPCMHLDTVFTMLDVDKFVIHPGILRDLRIFSLNKSANRDGFTVREETGKPERVLEKYLHADKIKLLPVAGGDWIAADREQFYDGANTLCIKPGTVVCYDRNPVTNEFLRKNGVEVLEIECSELSRGRGGPRCMTMPVAREG